MKSNEKKPEIPSKNLHPALLEKAKKSPALLIQSYAFPSGWHRRVPLKVRMTTTALPDRRQNATADSDSVALLGQEYYVSCNSNGALSALLPTGKRLGICPHEFEVMEWHSYSDLNNPT